MLKVWSMFKITDSPAAKFIPGRKLRHGPDSHETFEMIKTWMEECSTRHRKCGISKHTPLPSRVVDVGTSAEDGDICLHTTNENLPSHGEYAALSYCWGDSMAFTTTTATIEERKRRIHLASLPRTLRDAVYIARKLGIRYLWIDALCILQGDDDVARLDWEIESGKMQDIYGNAFLTIVAAAANDCDGGILVPRCPEMRSCSLPYSKDPSKGAIMIAPRQWVNVSDEAINRRAWTLQERCLSPRVLFYGSERVIWRCESSIQCEDGDPDLGVNKAFAGDLGMQASLELGIGDPRDAWKKIIQDYSRRELTKPSDRFPALSGMAQKFALQIGGSYYAGLWENTFLTDLCWCRVAVATTVAIEEQVFEYRAPSWSWCATEGPVEYRGRELPRRYYARVLECKVEAKGVDPYGMVKSGKVVLKGPLRPGLCRFDRRELKNGGVDVSKPVNLFGQFGTGENWFGKGWLDRLDAPSSMALCGQSVEAWCLAIWRTYAGSCGLLLEPTDETRSTFRRIGIAWISRGEDWPDRYVSQTVTII